MSTGRSTAEQELDYVKECIEVAALTRSRFDVAINKIKERVSWDSYLVRSKHLNLSTLIENKLPHIGMDLEGNTLYLRDSENNDHFKKVIDCFVEGAKNGKNYNSVPQQIKKITGKKAKVFFRGYGCDSIKSFLKKYVPNVSMDEKQVLRYVEVSKPTVVDGDLCSIGIVHGKGKDDEWKVVLVDSKEMIEKVKGKIEGERMIAVDVEGVWGKEAKLPHELPLSIVQIGIPSYAFLFDLKCPDRSSIVSFLCSLFSDSSATFLIHDLRLDIIALYYGLGLKKVPENLIDTQIAFGVSSNGKKKRVGLNEALKRHQLPENPLKERFSNVFNGPEEDKVNMIDGRPLNTEFARYAAYDVTGLAYLYERIAKEQKSGFQARILADSKREAQMCVDESAVKLYRLEFDMDVLDCEARVDMQKDTLLIDPASLVTPPLRPLDEEPAEYLLEELPGKLTERIREELAKRDIAMCHLQEIVVDRGRAPELTVYAHGSIFINDLSEDSSELVDNIHSHMIELSKSGFRQDNRLSLPGKLHRVSRITGFEKDPPRGLTIRVGRHWPGSAHIILDVLARVAEGESLLLVGPPGVGKTTLLRDVVMLMADKLRRRTILVDTSGEVAGDGVEHNAFLGRARQMPVPQRDKQHIKLIEAVQNHNPEVIVIDEISNRAEVSAVETISQRGVSMVATAHGNSIYDILRNPVTRPLLGGIRHAILSDLEAKKRGNKVIAERSALPIFPQMLEIRSYTEFVLWKDTGNAVDTILLGKKLRVVKRCSYIDPEDPEKVILCQSVGYETPLIKQEDTLNL